MNFTGPDANGIYWANAPARPEKLMRVYVVRDARSVAFFECAALEITRQADFSDVPDATFPADLEVPLRWFQPASTTTLKAKGIRYASLPPCDVRAGDCVRVSVTDPVRDGESPAGVRHFLGRLTDFGHGYPDRTLTLCHDPESVAIAQENAPHVDFGRMEPLREMESDPDAEPVVIELKIDPADFTK